MILLAAGLADVAGDDPPFFILLLLLLAVALIAAVCILIAAVICIACVIIFSTLGIISAATVIGLYNRSLGKGFRALVWMMSCFFGGFAGAAGLWMLSKFKPPGMSLQSVLSTGAIVGVCAGIVGALVTIQLARWAAGWLGQKYAAMKRAD